MRGIVTTTHTAAINHRSQGEQLNVGARATVAKIDQSPLVMLHYLSIFLKHWMDELRETESVETAMNVIEKFNKISGVVVPVQLPPILSDDDLEDSEGSGQSSDVSDQSSQCMSAKPQRRPASPRSEPFSGLYRESFSREFRAPAKCRASYEGFSQDGIQCAIFNVFPVHTVILLSTPGFKWEPILDKYLGAVRVFTQLTDEIGFFNWLLPVSRGM